MDLRWATDADRELILAAAALFDHPPRPEHLDRFLSSPGHHLGLAVVDGRAAGFVTGVEMTHPDKGTEMLLYELSVGEEFRGRGIGRALVDALRELARERGCYGMWVLTGVGNEIAQRTYMAADGVDRGPYVMIDWDLT